MAYSRTASDALIEGESPLARAGSGWLSLHRAPREGGGRSSRDCRLPHGGAWKAENDGYYC